MANYIDTRDLNDRLNVLTDELESLADALAEAAEAHEEQTEGLPDSLTMREREAALEEATEELEAAKQAR